MTPDSELATLYAKIEFLTKERLAALELAEETAKKNVELKAKVEHLRNLWQAAERRLKKGTP